MTDTSVQKLVINRPTKTQFEQLQPNKYELWAVDPEFNGGKVLATDSDGDIIESTLAASSIQEKTTIVQLDATDSITIDSNVIYNGGEQTSLTIALPSGTVDNNFLCEIDFTSGATPTVFSAPNTIKWRGTDIINGSFIPSASTRYTVMIYYNGVDFVAIERGV